MDDSVRSPTLLERKALRVVVAGFALVIALLLGAAVGAVNSARSIRDTANQLAQEQFTVAQLVSELQLEQAALSSLAHQYFRAGESLNKDRLLTILTQLEAVLQRVLQDSSIATDHMAWERLRGNAHEFSELARKVAGMNPISREAMDELFDAHSRILEDVSTLMEASSGRSVEAEVRIATQSAEALSRALVWLGSAGLLAGVCAFFTARAEAKIFARMRWQESELGRVSWQMLQSQEEALRRFSHELHDDLGQSLTAIRAVLENTTPETLDRSREDCLALVDDSVTNVRELSQLLRPVILDDFGLSAALDWLGERFSERTRIGWDYHSNLEARLPDEVETHLFRITQESLTNVARHSRASCVTVRLIRTGDEVRLSIVDDGQGFDEDGPRDSNGGGLGLVGMRARARQIGAELSVSSPQSQGVRIEVFLRLSAEDMEEEAHGIEDTSSAG